MSRGPGARQRGILVALAAGPISEKRLRRRAGRHYARAMAGLARLGAVQRIDGFWVAISGATNAVSGAKPCPHIVEMVSIEVHCKETARCDSAADVIERNSTCIDPLTLVSWP